MLESVFIPAPERNSRNLWIMLHGLGDSVEGYRWLPETISLPWMNYLLVNAPDPYYGGFSWFDFTGNIVPGVRRSRDLLFKLLDAQRDRGFETENTVLGGFSQGCLMSIEVGLRYSRRFAGIVGVSGYICEPDCLLREMSPAAKSQRILMTHGIQDPMVPIVQVRPQVQVLQRAGLNIEFREFQKGHTIAGQEELSVIRDFVVAGFPAR